MPIFGRVLEAMTQAFGRSLTEAGGIRSSRVIAVASAETKIQTGLANAQSADGIAVLLAAGNFGAVGAASTPSVGTRFRLLSGSFVRQSSLVVGVVGDPVMQLSLAGDGFGAAFTGESWEVVRDATDQLFVETALGWPEAGEIAVASAAGPVRYRYDARVVVGPQPAGFSGLRARRHTGRDGRIVCIAGALVAEGTGVTIDDGEDTVSSIVRFEFDRDDFIRSSWPHSLSPVIKVPITNAMTAGQVRTALLAAIQSVSASAVDTPGLALVASAVGTRTIGLLHMVPGGQGPLHVVSDVPDIGFIVDGARGVEVTHFSPDEVFEFARTYSAIDGVRSSFLVGRAVGEDLSVDGLYLSVPRPAGLVDDEVYRRVIMAMAYAARGPTHAIEGVLTAILGPAGFEIFEDFGVPAPFARGTANATSADGVNVAIAPGTFGRIRSGQRYTARSGAYAGISRFISARTNPYSLTLASSIGGAFAAQSFDVRADLRPQNLGRIFLRRVYTAAPSPAGRAILGGEDARPITDTTHVTAGLTPLVVGGVRLLDEPAPLSRPSPPASPADGRRYRLVARGTPGGPKIVFNGSTLVASAAAFGTEIRPGDLFVMVSGPQAGTMATLKLRNSSTQLTVSPMRGVTYRRVPNAFPIAPDWLIIRELSNFRYTLPTAEQIIEDDVGSLVTVWSYTGTDVNNVAIADVEANGGLYIAIQPVLGTTKTFLHRLRIQPESNAEVEFLLSTHDTSSVAGSGGQVSFRVGDGSKLIAVGVIGQGGGNIGVGFTSAAGAALGPWAGAQLAALTNGTWATFTIKKQGTSSVELYQDGVLIQRLAYSSFSNTASTQIEFGAFDINYTTESRWKQADWHTHTETDYWNSRSALGQTAVAQDLIDAGGNGFFGAGDIGPSVRRVFIRDFTRLNTAGGNARGLWNVSAVVNADRVTLIGPTRDGAQPATSPAMTAIVDGGQFTTADGVTVTAMGGANFIGAAAGDMFVVKTGLTAGRRAPILSVSANYGQVVLTASIGAIALESFSVTSAASRRRLRVHDRDAFVWPDHLGAQVVIESGTNAGTYAIAKFLDPVSYRSIDHTYVRTLARLVAAGGAGSAMMPADILIMERTNVVELTTELPDPFSQASAPWHLLPLFPADAGPTRFEVVAKGSLAGAVLTLPQALPIGGGGYNPPVAIYTSLVASAHLEDTIDANAVLLAGPPPSYGRAPFYVRDDWGYIRELVLKLVAGGVITDFDQFFRDATGPHILGSQVGVLSPLG